MKFLQNVCNHLLPIPWPGLSEEFDAFIPIAVSAIELPAPIRCERQQQPCRLAHGAGEVGDGGVYGNDYIQLRDQAGGVEKVLDVGRQIDQAGIAYARLRSRIDLKAVK